MDEKAQKRRADSMKRLENAIETLNTIPITVPLRLAHTPVAKRKIVATQIAGYSVWEEEDEFDSDDDASDIQEVQNQGEDVQNQGEVGQVVNPRPVYASERVTDDLWQEYRTKFIEKEKECIRLTMERSQARTELIETQDEMRKMAIQIKEMTAEMEAYRRRV